MIELGIIGNAATATFYLFLVVLLLSSWRGQVIGGLLIAACLANIAWASVLVAGLYGRIDSEFVVFVVEIVRTGAWLTFLSVLLARIGASRIMVLSGVLIWTVVLLAGVSLQFQILTFPAGVSMTQILNTGGLLLAMTGLLLVEQLHRNSPDESRKGIKVLMLGIGGIFAYDLFLYSQSLMLRGLEPWAWHARGLVNASFVPVIAIATRANKDWSLRIFVSRQVVFYSTTLVAIGIYLLLMSAVGYWISIRGGSWSGLSSATFFVGAVVLLVFLIFSANLRARLRVFLSKHFFRNKYDYRREWLRLISTLGEMDQGSARRIAIRSLAQIVESPIGFLWLLDENKAVYRFASSYNSKADLPDIGIDDSLVEFVNKDGWVVDINEYHQNREIYGQMILPEWLDDHPDAWLIVPLITRREILGLVLLTRAAGSLNLNYEDRDLLKTVADHVAVHLSQERTDALLAEARQFEAYNRLTAFLMHDLNNLIAQQSLIVANASKHKRNPDFVDDAMSTVASSVERMKRVMDQLKRGEEAKQTKKTGLKFMVSAAADRCADRMPTPELEFRDREALVDVNAEQFTMVLTHLIRNAQDSTDSDGRISVSTDESDGWVSVTVADDGRGMSEEFIRERLFRPFDSTKGSQGMGIGAYQAREFAYKMRGDLDVTSELDEGTTVTLRFPVK